MDHDRIFEVLAFLPLPFGNGILGKWKPGRTIHSDKQDLGLGMLTMMPNRRQSLSPRARQRLPALHLRVTVLLVFLKGYYAQN